MAATKAHFTLAEFRKISPLDLGPVAFAQCTRSFFHKSDVHTKYLAIASSAAKSEDSNERAIGGQMQELWLKEQGALRKYWKEVEPLRKLRTRNIISAAKDSSKLQREVGRHQLRQALIELQQEKAQEQTKKSKEQQDVEESDGFSAGGTLLSSDPSDDDYTHKSSTRTSLGSTSPLERKSNIDGPGEPSSSLYERAWFVNDINVSTRLMSARRANMVHQGILHETDDLLTLNFIFTKEFIKYCFGDEESQLVDELVMVDVQEAPQEEVNLIVKYALTAACKEYVDFKAILRNSSLELIGLAGDILTTYTTTNALWQSQTKGLGRNEDTYIKQSIMPMIDAVFGSLCVSQHWQRDPLPVPNGYEEVLRPDFFGEVDRLCFAVMEVKKPNATEEEVEEDARKLPCMMKIALNMLIHANVQDATVIGFLVNESVCEVFTMNLEHEAIYIPKSIGQFKLPQDRLDLSQLLLALGPLNAVKNLASKMVKSIKKRSRLGVGKCSPLTRPSYYVSGSNIPAIPPQPEAK